MHELNQKILDSGFKKTYVAKKISISLPLLSLYLNNKRPMPLHIKQRINELLS